MQPSSFHLQREKCEREGAVTRAVNTEVSWRVERVEGPYGAASGPADSSTLFPLTGSNPRAAAAPLAGRSSCADASKHTGTQTDPRTLRWNIRTHPSAKMDCMQSWKRFTERRTVAKQRPLTPAEPELWACGGIANSSSLSLCCWAHQLNSYRSQPPSIIHPSPPPPLSKENNSSSSSKPPWWNRLGDFLWFSLAATTYILHHLCNNIVYILKLLDG